MHPAIANFLVSMSGTSSFSDIDANSRQYEVYVESAGSEENTDGLAGKSWKPLSERVLSVEGTNCWMVDKIFRVRPSSNESVGKEQLARDFWKKAHKISLPLMIPPTALACAATAYILALSASSYRWSVTNRFSRFMFDAVAFTAAVGGQIALGVLLGLRNTSASQIKLWSESLGEKFARDRTEALHKTFPEIYKNRLMSLLTKQELLKSYEESLHSSTRTFLDTENKTNETWLNSFLKQEVHPFDEEVMSFAYNAEIPVKKREISQIFSILKTNFEKKQDVSLQIQQLSEGLYSMLTADIV